MGAAQNDTVVKFERRTDIQSGNAPENEPPFLTEVAPENLTQEGVDKAIRDGKGRPLHVNGKIKENIRLGDQATDYKKKTGSKFLGALRNTKDHFTSKDGLKSFITGAAVMGGVKYAARSTTALAGLSGPAGAFAAGALGAGGLTVWDIGKEYHVAYKDTGHKEALRSIFNRASLAKHGKKFGLRTLTGTAGALTVVGADAIIDGIEEAGGVQAYFNEKLNALKSINTPDWLSSGDWLPSGDWLSSDNTPDLDGEYTSENVGGFMGILNDAIASIKEFFAKFGIGSSASPEIKPPELSDPVMGEIISDLPEPDLNPLQKPEFVEQALINDLPPIDTSPAGTINEDQMHVVQVTPEGAKVVEMSKDEYYGGFEDAADAVDMPLPWDEQLAALDTSGMGERLQYVHDYAVNGEGWALSEMADTLVYDEETRAMAFEMYAKAAQSPIAEIADHAKRNLAYVIELWPEQSATDEMIALAEQAPPLPEAIPEAEPTSYTRIEAGNGKALYAEEFKPETLEEDQLVEHYKAAYLEAAQNAGYNPDDCNVTILENFKGVVACNDNTFDTAPSEELQLVAGQN